MTVQELIEKLKDLPPDAEVHHVDESWGQVATERVDSFKNYEDKDIVVLA